VSRQIPTGHKGAALLIRLSADERARIKQRAESCAVTVSEFIRRCALDRPLTGRADIEALAELRRQGGLIKHLALSDRSHAYEYRVALNLIHETIRRLIRDSEGPKRKS
jgi:hypothetical protein